MNNGKKYIEELERADAHPYGARPFKRKNYINKFLTLTESILSKKESNSRNIFIRLSYLVDSQVDRFQKPLGQLLS